MELTSSSALIMQDETVDEELLTDYLDYYTWQLDYNMQRSDHNMQQLDYNMQQSDYSNYRREYVWQSNNED